MLRFFCAVVLSCLAVSAVHAESPRFCKNRFVPGEKIEARFMGMSYELMMYALAEKYCGAKHVSMAPSFLGYLENQGCGPNTEIYQDIAVSISNLENASLTQMAADGDPTLSVSEQQAKNWAKNASEQLGGCNALIKFHDSKQESRK